MCGIGGLVSFGATDAERDAARAAELSAALAHRGPDGAGSWRSPDGRALFVHRRLAIIDPSRGGAQPMVSPDGRHVIVFNGEMYNYRELRTALEQGGRALFDRFGYGGAASSDRAAWSRGACR